MAHKTRVSGTNYEISGGKTLIGGTAYSIKNGKTLVDGTAYEVGFDDGMRTLTIIGDFSETDYFAHDITYYVSDNYTVSVYGGTHTLPVGTSMHLSLSAFESGATVSVFWNGQLVFTTTKVNSYERYYFTLNHDITLEKVENSSKSCYVYITET